MSLLSHHNNILQIDGNKGAVESTVNLTIFLLINYLILECGNTQKVLAVTVRKFKTTKENSENTPLTHPKAAGLALH